MAQCRANNINGEPCGGFAVEGSDFCFIHSPERSKERAEARKKGGARSRAGHGGDTDSIPGEIRTLQDVLLVLDYTLQEALVLNNSIQRGRLLVAIASAFIEAIQVGDFEGRLQRLEQFYGEQFKN